MTKPRLFSIVFKSTLSLIVFMLLQTTVSAQSAKVEGLIKGRDGDTMILQSSDSREVTVLLTENTEVSQKQGMLQVRRKEMAMAALIPGLDVQVEGTYDAQNWQSQSPSKGTIWNEPKPLKLACTNLRCRLNRTNKN